MNVVDFIHSASLSDLPAAVVHQARRCLVDLLGVAAAGRGTDLSRITHGFAVRQMGASGPGARLIFDGRRASAAGAAYAGASTIDSFDAHDGHALTKGHAGVAILPAILAIVDADGLDTTLDDMLAALVVGYEIATRAGIALHASVTDYHTSGAWNGVAVAGVASRLLGLGAAATRHALGTAEYHGPRSQMMRCIDHPTMLKDGSGWGAFAGVAAAYLAEDGFTGAPAITIEAPGQAELWGDLGSRWRILEQYFKPYPVCRWAQPAIEAARAAVRDTGLAATAITEVEVETFHAGVRLGTAPPPDTEAAQYALGHPLAAFLVRGRVGAAEIGPEGLADPEIRAMLGRIRLVEAPDLTAAFPARRIARVRILDRDGRVHRSVDTEADGDPARPLPDAALADKFRALSAGIDPTRAGLIEAILTGGGDPSRRSFLDACLAPAAAHAP